MTVTRQLHGSYSTDLVEAVHRARRLQRALRDGGLCDLLEGGALDEARERVERERVEDDGRLGAHLCGLLESGALDEARERVERERVEDDGRLGAQLGERRVGRLVRLGARPDLVPQRLRARQAFLLADTAPQLQVQRAQRDRARRLQVRGPTTHPPTARTGTGTRVCVYVCVWFDTGREMQGVRERGGAPKRASGA